MCECGLGIGDKLLDVKTAFVFFVVYIFVMNIVLFKFLFICVFFVLEMYFLTWSWI